MYERRSVLEHFKIFSREKKKQKSHEDLYK